MAGRTYALIGLVTGIGVIAGVALVTLQFGPGRERGDPRLQSGARVAPLLDIDPEAKPPRPRPWEDDVMAWAGRSLPEGRGIDITSGRPHRVDLFQDPGQPWVNRAQVDLDRDGSWDETWAFTESDVTRSIAPADDGVYSRTLKWNGGGWAEP